MTEIKEIWSIVCDDLRVEVGQKVSLMGIYSSTITVKSKVARFPRLCIFKRLTSTSTCRVTAQLDLLGPSGKSALPDGERPEIANVELGPDTNLGFAVGPLRLSEPGRYIFSVTLHPKGGDRIAFDHPFTLELGLDG